MNDPDIEAYKRRKLREEQLREEKVRKAKNFLELLSSFYAEDGEDFSETGRNGYMRWKKVLALGLCLMIVGCGQTADPKQGQNPSIDVTGQEQITQTDSKAQADEEEKSVNDKEQSMDEDTQAKTDTTKDQTEQGEIERTEGEGKLQELAGKETGGTEVKLDNAYMRAAFLADQVYENHQESVLLSPLSLEMALGLAAEGASGETAQELYKYLGNENYADWAKQYMDFAQSLESSDEPEQEGEGMLFDSAKYSFRYELANSIWVRKQDRLNEAYQKLVGEKFAAEAQNVDFMGAPKQTADTINAWCDEHTHGMIEKIVEPDMFSMDLSTILMNTVYFESPWADEWGLTEHEFTALSGEKSTQEMLSDKLRVYYENEYATGFAKSYYNGFQFIGILPKQEGDFKISDLDLKSFMESVTYDYDVKVIAPKLNYETSTNSKEIVNILEKQGLHKVFDKEFAEFDRLVDGQALHIDDIIQKTKLEMDEEGTRAAAVTAIMMRTNSIAMEEKRKVKEVYLDRPFAFMIYDSRNDQIMFIGKVTEL